MIEYITFLAVLCVFFLVGLLLGTAGEAQRWREKGDHAYMNRKESGGRLYHVKRERGPRTGDGC